MAVQVHPINEVSEQDVEESKTVEDFLKSLENGHKALANVLKHRNNQRKWAYLRQVWPGGGGLWLVGPIVAVQSVCEALCSQAECACKTSNTLCPLLPGDDDPASWLA